MHLPICPPASLICATGFACDCLMVNAPPKKFASCTLPARPAAEPGGDADRRSTRPWLVSISDPTGMLRSCTPSVNECPPGGVTVTVPDTRPMSIERPTLGGGSFAGWAVATAPAMSTPTTATLAHPRRQSDAAP